MQKGYFIAAVILVAILVAGILAHSVTLFVLNRQLPPGQALGTGQTPQEVFATRASFLEISRLVQAVCLAVFTLAGLFWLHLFDKNSAYVKFSGLFAFLGVVVAAVLACTLPFAWVDSQYAGEYLLPLWRIFFNIACLSILLFLSNFLKYRRARKKAPCA